MAALRASIPLRAGHDVPTPTKAQTALAPMMSTLIRLGQPRQLLGEHRPRHCCQERGAVGGVVPEDSRASRPKASSDLPHENDVASPKRVRLAWSSRATPGFALDGHVGVLRQTPAARAYWVMAAASLERGVATLAAQVVQSSNRQAEVALSDPPDHGRGRS